MSSEDLLGLVLNLIMLHPSRCYVQLSEHISYQGHHIRDEGLLLLAPPTAKGLLSEHISEQGLDMRPEGLLVFIFNSI